MFNTEELAEQNELFGNDGNDSWFDSECECDSDPKWFDSEYDSGFDSEWFDSEDFNLPEPENDF